MMTGAEKPGVGKHSGGTVTPGKQSYEVSEFLTDEDSSGSAVARYLTLF
jgi:hypothetical protein